jgi:hypothetical protein
MKSSFVIHKDVGGDIGWEIRKLILPDEGGEIEKVES